MNSWRLDLRALLPVTFDIARSLGALRRTRGAGPDGTARSNTTGISMGEAGAPGQAQAGRRYDATHSIVPGSDPQRISVIVTLGFLAFLAHVVVGGYFVRVIDDIGKTAATAFFVLNLRPRPLPRSANMCATCLAAAGVSEKAI